MRQNINKQNATKPDYRILFETCPQCGREVVLPCRDCLLKETDELLLIHYDDPDMQLRYEEVFNFNRKHGCSLFSSQPDDRQDESVLTLVRNYPDGC